MWRKCDHLKRPIHLFSSEARKPSVIEHVSNEERLLMTLSCY